MARPRVYRHNVRCPECGSNWMPKGERRTTRMHRRGEKRTAGVVGSQPAAVRDPDGSRWADFEIGERNGETFLRLYERLPEAELYRMDGHRVCGWQPADRHDIDKGGAVNWNEGLHFVV